MKPSKYTFFTSLLCASGLSAGLCFCVMTSFAVPADGLSLVCACVLAALLFSALLLLPKSWIWLLGMAALAGGGLYMLYPDRTQFRAKYRNQHFQRCTKQKD